MRRVAGTAKTRVPWLQGCSRQAQWKPQPPQTPEASGHKGAGSTLKLPQYRLYPSLPHPIVTPNWPCPQANKCGRLRPRWPPKHAGGEHEVKGRNCPEPPRSPPVRRAPRPPNPANHLPKNLGNIRAKRWKTWPQSTRYGTAWVRSALMVRSARAPSRRWSRSSGRGRAPSRTMRAAVPHCKGKGSM